jgi:hypothetical protein
LAASFNVSNTQFISLSLTGANNQLAIDGNAPGLTFAANAGEAGVVGDILIFYSGLQYGSIAFNGTGGGNTLIVDSSLGAVRAPIDFNGGAGGGNSLVLQGGAATSDAYSPGPGLGEGTSTLVIGGVTESVHFVNLAPVIDTVAGPLVVNGTAGDDAINYSADPASPSRGLVSVNNLETISFLNKTTLTLDAGAGSDTINLNDPTTPTGLTGITVNGGDPTSSGDTLVVNGTTGADAINYAINSATSSTITGAGPVSITGNDVEQVLLNGRGGGDTFRVTTAAGIDQVTTIRWPTATRTTRFR